MWLILSLVISATPQGQVVLPLALPPHVAYRKESECENAVAERAEKASQVGVHEGCLFYPVFGDKAL